MSFPHDQDLLSHTPDVSAVPERPTFHSREVTAVDLPSLLHGFSADPEKRDHEPPSSHPTTSTKESNGSPISLTEKSLHDPDPHAVVPPTLGGAEGAAAPLIEDENAGWTYPEGGRGWWVVLGCTIIAAVTLGWPLAWGVFQSYYKEYLFPDVENSVLSTLGSLPGLLMNPVAFVVGKLADRYGYRLFIICGCVVGIITMLTAAFSTTLWQLFLTQGLLQGICNGLILSIAMSAPSQWFLRKRALATGIVIAGCSFGGGAATLILQQLLTHLGLRKTLLIYTGIHAVLMTAAVLMIRDRPHPLSTRFTHAPIQWVDRTLFRDPLFWLVAGSIFFTVFGFMPPYFYIQQFTRAKLPGLDAALYALPAAVMNFSAAAGRSLIGMFADRIGVLNAFILSALLSALVQLLVWNFATTYGEIMAFSVLVGFFGAASISLIGPLGAKLFGARNLATISGILMMFNMPGQAAGAPLLGALLQATGGVGGTWHVPVVFSGVCCVVGAGVMVPARLMRERRVWAVY